MDMKSVLSTRHDKDEMGTLHGSDDSPDGDHGGKHPVRTNILDQHGASVLWSKFCVSRPTLSKRFEGSSATMYGLIIRGDIRTVNNDKSEVYDRHTCT